MVFEYDLTNKAKIYLLLYFFMKDFDMIDYVYKLKLNVEHEDNISWHYLCPRNVFGKMNWHPLNINNQHKIYMIEEVYKYNLLFMKMIVNRSFMYNKMDTITLKKKIKAMNHILKSCPNISEYVSFNVNQLLTQYNNFLLTSLDHYKLEIFL